MESVVGCPLTVGSKGPELSLIPVSGWCRVSGFGIFNSVVSSWFSVLSFSLISYLGQACGFKFFDFYTGDAVAFHFGDSETMAFVVESVADAGDTLQAREHKSRQGLESGIAGQ